MTIESRETKEPPAPSPLTITPEKVAFIVLKAREFQAKVAPFDEGDVETTDQQDGADGVYENRPLDPSLQELTQFIDGLNEDERIDLVALSWVGRGAYEAEDFDTARGVARQEPQFLAVRYLVGDPTIADSLEEGMAIFGIDMADIEGAVASEG